ncbi:hypothetical protein GR207_35755, partial [Rhizobium leguminosarum]|nr:hypothetical protein [Rhizobium ruizarguesonis]
MQVGQGKAHAAGRWWERAYAGLLPARCRDFALQCCKSASRSAMNWDDTRIFLAITRAPSARAAARSLGID